MGLMLSIYTKDAFEEILLPALDNANFTFQIDGERYGLEESVEVCLEVVDAQWRIFRNPAFTLLRMDQDCFEQPIHDGDILRLHIGNKQSITIAVIAAEEGLSPFAKYSLNDIYEVTIGKSADNSISINQLGLVSAHHARLVRKPEGWVLEDTSKNGIYIGKERIRGTYLLRFGDCINIFGYKIVFFGTILAVDGNSIAGIDDRKLTPVVCKADPPIPGTAARNKRYFRRSPRYFPDLCTETLAVESPPSLHVMDKRPLLLVIGPAFTMAIPMLLGSLMAIWGRGGASGGAYMYTGLVTAFASALIGVIWAIVNLRYTRRKEQEQKKLRFDLYSNYLIEITDYLKEKQIENRNILLEVYPPADVCASYSEEDPRLWTRNPSHDDFLFIRLGIGDIPFQMQIQTQKQKFTLVNDPMADKPELLRKEYEILRDVPVGISLLEHRIVGIISSDLRGASSLVRSLAVQIAANHCYTEVKMVFIGNFGSRTGMGWDFARWLPHTWSENHKLRYFAQTPEESREVLYALSRLFRFREENNGGRGETVLPHYVVFLDNMAVLENEPAAKYILNPQPGLGLTTVLLSENYEGLPNACQYIIHHDQEFSGVYSVTDTLDKRKNIQFDQVGAEEVDLFARRLSSVRVNELESGSDIPAVLDFFDMLGVSNFEEMDVPGRWKKNRTYDTLRALIGKKAGGANCYLDIHEKYHGPHGLLAGTTGSGKSETLQTYILSLSINYSPLDVAFLLIDFKGGGMANLFEHLPHTVGLISNLSGSQIRRAMVSIKSENLRRQRIFGEYGVNHIDGYTKLFKNQEASEPIPHLMIVIDEFAELKREEPDFMRELISVAQVGRSLGVHLILATQKPAGTVDDNIRSNTKFRICLRVQDRQDSSDMLHKPDAAYITQVGRGYLQVGNDEVYELFQSGWSGARYDSEQQKHKVASVTMLDALGRAAMVGSRSELQRKKRRRYQWVFELVNSILYTAQRLDTTPVQWKRTGAGEEVLKTVAADLNNRVKQYADTRRNSLQLQKMLSLWPEAVDPADITQQLIQRMDAAGERFPEWKERTQLDAVVEYLRDTAVRERCENHLQLWLPPLPEQLPLDQLMDMPSDVLWPGETEEWTLEAPVGLCDAPENQMQITLTIDFAETGHCVVCGLVDSGKSTFLQTLLYSLVNRYSPQHLNIYALDFSSAKLNVFSGLAHVGGVMDGRDLTRIQKFFKMLDNIMIQRQKQLAGGDFRQYIKLHRGEMPAILVAIDQYAVFREKTGNAYDDLILRISSVGAGCGIYLAVTAGGFGGAEIPNRLAENFRNPISLEMGDKFKYGDILRTMHFATLPEANVKGRGLVNVGGAILEFQTALAVLADDDYQRSEKIEARCQFLNSSWTGKWAEEIPTIPEKPVWNEFCSLTAFQTLSEDDRHLPIGYLEEDASVYGVDLSQSFCYLISGRAHTGRTTALRLLMSSAAAKGGQLVVIDGETGELRRNAEDLNARYIYTRKENYEFWKEILPEFKARNQEKRMLVEKGCEDEEIFEAMLHYEKIYIFIHDLGSFMDWVYAPADTEAAIGQIHGFIENVAEKGKLHQIYLFAVCNPDELTQYNGRRAFNAFVGYRAGIHLGGDVDRQRFFSFDNIPFAERTKVTKPGVALAASPQKPGQADKIVLPQWKG